MTTIIIQPSSDTLSKGAIAGIVIGSIVGTAALLALGLLLYRHQPKSSSPESFMQPQEGAYDKEAVEQISPRQIAEPASGRLGLQYPAEVMEQTGGRLASDH
jgi:hypothetical protein